MILKTIHFVIAIMAIISHIEGHFITESFIFSSFYQLMVFPRGYRWTSLLFDKHVCHNHKLCYVEFQLNESNVELWLAYIVSQNSDTFHILAVLLPGAWNCLSCGWRQDFFIQSKSSLTKKLNGIPPHLRILLSFLRCLVFSFCLVLLKTNVSF